MHSLRSLLCLQTCLALAVGTSLAKEPASRQITPLANDYVVVFESPDPQSIYCYTPGITRLENGRLVATLDLGGKTGRDKHGITKRGRILTSDDQGRSWQPRGEFAFGHARPFLAGGILYVLGQSGDLMVIRSEDNGETWSAESKLTDGQRWHQSACNVHYANDAIYLVMERRIPGRMKRGWEVSELAPVLMRAKESSDLTKRESWAFASELSFQDAIPYHNTGAPDLDHFGVPFYPSNYPETFMAAPRRASAPIGWLETNVVQFTDPNHLWHDPKGKTFHLWARAHTGGTGYAAIAKVTENEDGTMTTSLETMPSGNKVLFLPCPGGQMRFHVLFDEKTRLYWLLSSQATDSMTRADALPDDRYNLPNNERHRLQLHFSTNMVDWCFAGIVATGNSPKEARHYASMVIDGENLHVLSRSSDQRGKSAHDGNLITFHTVKDFRSLVY